MTVRKRHRFSAGRCKDCLFAIHRKPRGGGRNYITFHPLGKFYSPGSLPHPYCGESSKEWMARVCPETWRLYRARNGAWFMLRGRLRGKRKTWPMWEAPLAPIKLKGRK